MAINVAIDYSSVESNGTVITKLDEALGLIDTLSNLLNEETLMSDVGSFQNLNTKLSSLKSELGQIKTKITDNVSTAKTYSNAIVNGVWPVI